jgi:hypothetical protein
MSKVVSLIGGLGLGIGLMYLLDPEKGEQRRTQIQDKARRLWRIKRQAWRAIGRDTSNRLQGLVVELQSRIHPGTPEDQQLTERVRSALGRAVSHPKAIQVLAENGNVRLRGAVLEDQFEGLIKAVWAVEGVDSIEHQLRKVQDPAHIPEFQGSLLVPERIPDVLRSEWKPATALAMGTVGGVVALLGLAMKGLPRGVLEAVGGAILAKSFYDVEGRRMLAALDPRAPTEPSSGEASAGPV